MKILKPILTALLCAMSFGGCFLFENTASITISLDGNALRQFANKPITKGFITDHAFEGLSLVINVEGDEIHTETVDIPRSDDLITLKVDRLRVGAVIKVRVDLTGIAFGEANKRVLISGGTKRFTVTSGENNVPIQMGNYTDILVWYKGGSTASYGFDELTRDTWTIGNNITYRTNQTFDAVTGYLAYIENGDYTISSWRGYGLAQNGYGTEHNMAVKNGDIYTWSDSVDVTATSMYIKKNKSNIAEINLTNSFLKSFTAYGEKKVLTLAFSPDGKKLYLSFYIGISSYYSHYITSYDVSDDGTFDIANFSPPVKVTGMYDDGGKDAILKGVESFQGEWMAINDTRVQDGYVWVLVKESTTSVSRGALIRFDMSLQNYKVFGWTPKPISGTHYYTPENTESENFFYPLKFAAVRPGELVIIDDGKFHDTGTAVDVDRVIIFDTEKEIVSKIIDQYNTGSFGYTFTN